MAASRAEQHPNAANQRNTTATNCLTNQTECTRLFVSNTAGLMSAPHLSGSVQVKSAATLRHTTGWAHRYPPANGTGDLLLTRFTAAGDLHERQRRCIRVGKWCTVTQCSLSLRPATLEATDPCAAKLYGDKGD